MPDDPQQQLDALRRNLCGDCSVGPFKGGRRAGGLRITRRAAWLLMAGALLGVAAAVLGLWLKG